MYYRKSFDYFLLLIYFFLFEMYLFPPLFGQKAEILIKMCKWFLLTLKRTVRLCIGFCWDLRHYNNILTIQEPELGTPQEKPKRLKLVVDVSGSMYR